MKLAINEATTMPRSFEEDMAAYASAGFDAVELWLDKLKPFLEKHTLKDARKLLADRGIKAIGACYQGGLMLTRDKQRQEVLAEFRTKLETCEALGVPVLVVPSDFPAGSVTRDDYDRAADGLREAADIAGRHKVALAIEFIKGGKLVGSLRTALALARKTEKKNVGVLLDTFHLYAGASKVEHILEMKKSELLLVHINDLAPGYIEIATDKDRVLPGEGVLPLKEMLNTLSRIGYDGYCSVELFNEELWRQDTQEAARLVRHKASRFFGL